MIGNDVVKVVTELGYKNKIFWHIFSKKINNLGGWNWPKVAILGANYQKAVYV